MTELQAEVAPVPDMPAVRVIRLRGRATFDNAPALRTSILGEISKTEASAVVVELGHVEEMDTAGAAVLVEGLGLAGKRGVNMLLCGPSESVLNMFRLGGFEEILDCCCPGPAEVRRRLRQ